MKKKACIVDIKKKFRKKYLTQPSIDFDFWKNMWRCLQGTLIDTRWLLIYFTILWAFYLFE